MAYDQGMNALAMIAQCAAGQLDDGDDFIIDDSEIFFRYGGEPVVLDFEDRAQAGDGHWLAQGRKERGESSSNSAGRLLSAITTSSRGASRKPWVQPPSRSTCPQVGAGARISMLEFKLNFYSKKAEAKAIDF